MIGQQPIYIIKIRIRRRVSFPRIRQFGLYSEDIREQGINMSLSEYDARLVILMVYYWHVLIDIFFAKYKCKQIVFELKIAMLITESIGFSGFCFGVVEVCLG